MPCGDIAIAAIISRSTQEEYRQWSSKPVCRVGERTARPLHQFFNGRTVINGCLLAILHGGGSHNRALVHGRSLAQEGRKAPPCVRYASRGFVTGMLAFEEAEASRT